MELKLSVTITRLVGLLHKTFMREVSVHVVIFDRIIAPETTSLVKTLVGQLQSWCSLYGQSDTGASFSLTPHFYPACYNFACARHTST